MRFEKRLLAGVLAALGAFFLAASPAAAQSDIISVSAGGIQASFKIIGPNVMVTVTAPVTGWVAVGFDPSSMMKDADMKIGYVKDGVAYARDDYGNGMTSHNEDLKLGGTTNLVSFEGTEKDGVTTMIFVFPLDSGDPKDKPLTAGTHTIILAASNADNYGMKHRMRGKATIALP